MHCKSAKGRANVQKEYIYAKCKKTANKRKIHAKFTTYSEYVLSQLFYFIHPLTGAESRQKKGRRSRERRIVYPVIREVGAEKGIIIITRIIL